MKPGVDILMAIPWFTGFERDSLAKLNEAADLARLGPGELLFSNGDNLFEVHFLLAGQVAAAQSAASGELVLIDVLLPARALCLPAALLRLPAPVGIQTLTTVRLVVVPVAAIHEALSGEAQPLRRVLDCALRDAHEQTLEMVQLKTRSSPQRLAAYLAGLIDADENPARFVLPFEKRLLAARIGCSQENLSRAFAALRPIGVHTQGAAVVVRDVPALRALANGPRRR